MFTRLVTRKAKGELSWAELEPKRTPRCLSVSPVASKVTMILLTTGGRAKHMRYALKNARMLYKLYLYFLLPRMYLLLPSIALSQQPLPTFANSPLQELHGETISPTGRGARTALLHLSATANPCLSSIAHEITIKIIKYTQSPAFFDATCDLSYSNSRIFRETSCLFLQALYGSFSHPNKGISLA